MPLLRLWLLSDYYQEVHTTGKLHSWCKLGRLLQLSYADGNNVSKRKPALESFSLSRIRKYLQ